MIFCAHSLFRKTLPAKVRDIPKNARTTKTKSTLNIEIWGEDGLHFPEGLILSSTYGTQIAKNTAFTVKLAQLESFSGKIQQICDVLKQVTGIAALKVEVERKS